MKLKVKNLGPIKQGEIDLSKRFSIFVGYNNSGKTYMSQVIWSLLDFWGKENNKHDILILMDTILIPYTENNLDKFYDDFVEGEPTIVQIQIEDIKAIYGFYYNQIKERVIDNFNINKKISSFETLELSFANDINTFKSEAIIHNYGIGNSYYTFEKSADSLEIEITKYIKGKNNITLKLDYQDDNKSVLRFFLSDFVRSIFVIQQEEDDKFFLPADRSFYASHYKFIFASIKEEFEKFRKNKRNDFAFESNYTSSVNDLISSIYDLNLKTPKESGIYKDLIEELQHVIGGDIVTKSSNPDISSLATFKLKMDNKEELDMHLSSSSVNQLTTLYLYFKYWAKESGNTIIIDEPEENLHPRNQLA